VLARTPDLPEVDTAAGVKRAGIVEL